LLLLSVHVHQREISFHQIGNQTRHPSIKNIPNVPIDMQQANYKTNAQKFQNGIYVCNRRAKLANHIECSTSIKLLLIVIWRKTFRTDGNIQIRNIPFRNSPTSFRKNLQLKRYSQIPNKHIGQKIKLKICKDGSDLLAWILKREKSHSMFSFYHLGK